MSELDGTYYDRDYFERGIELGISGYSNYHWMPEFTIPMAMTIIEFLGIERNHHVLDFGCAKGYLVKAMRLLFRPTWGIDISRYAIEHVDFDVKPFCHLRTGDIILPESHIDFCIAKDVFEHISEESLGHDLRNLGINTIFAIIPLGNGNKCFTALPNNIDYTHQICQTVEWWDEFFEQYGWMTDRFEYQVPGIKDSYYEKYPKGHGFFVLKRNC
jgi:SAM-dependent methyltransferase